MADIKTHLNNIKGALYGKDVRSSIHDGIDTINKEVESTTGRQVDLENTFDQLIINAGNSNAEIVDARVKNDGTSYSKLGDRLDAVDSQLAHIEDKLENYKTINVLDFGVVADNDEVDNTLKINKILENINGRVRLYFPAGVYYFKTPLILKDVDVEGDGYSTILKYVNSSNSTFIEFGGERSYIKKLKIVNSKRNFDLFQKGLMLGYCDRNGSNLYKYSNRLLAEYIEIENFHTSLSIESCYTVNLNNINTYKDMIGFSVNKETIKQSQVNICTTILANHLYCNGTGGVYEQPEGSIGWEIYETSDITFINCISEMYEKSFYMDDLNNIQMFAPYFENTKKSSVFENVTGSVYILNPYINNVISSNQIAFIDFNSLSKLTMVGGRLLSNKSIALINKRNNSSVTVINPPIDNPVKSDNGWQFAGVLVLDRNGIISKTVKNTDEYGLSIGYYGTGLSLSPNTIKQNDSNQHIMFNIGDTNKIKIHNDGDFELFGKAKGLIMADYTGKRYKIFMNYDGVLKIEPLQ